MKLSILLLSLVGVLASAAGVATKLPVAAQNVTAQGEVKMQKAVGTFSVKMQPQGSLDSEPSTALARMTLDKEFAGDLAGVGKGEMLTAITGTKGSAGYVAIERFAGTLHGRKGSFVFQHSGRMNRGAQQLAIDVVPDSGTAELAGISGALKINIVDGQHFYEFEYSVP
jgi:hypothetical protein